MAQLSVLQAQGMYAGITSVGASVGSETSNRLPFYRLARKTESYSKAFVFIIAVTEVGCSDGVRARSDPVIGFEKRRVRPTDRLNITYLAHKRSVRPLVRLSTEIFRANCEATYTAVRGCMARKNHETMCTAGHGLCTA